MTEDQMNDLRLQSRKVKKYTTFFQIFNQKYFNKLGNKTNIRIPPTHYLGQNIWILKALDLNRGRGIIVVNNLDEIKKTLKKYYDGSMYEEFKLEKEKLKNEKLEKENKEDSRVPGAFPEIKKETIVIEETSNQKQKKMESKSSSKNKKGIIDKMGM